SRARALLLRLPLQFSDLFAPRLDLGLALHQQFAQLLPATFHLTETAVDHLHLLAALRELEAGLGQRLALPVAVGAHLDDSRLQLLDILTLRGRRAVGLRQ